MQIDLTAHKNMEIRRAEKEILRTEIMEREVLRMETMIRGAITTEGK